MPPAFTLSQDQTLHHFPPSLGELFIVEPNAEASAPSSLSIALLSLSQTSLKLRRHSRSASSRLPHQRRVHRVSPVHSLSTALLRFFRDFFRLCRKSFKTNILIDSIRFLRHPPAPDLSSIEASPSFAQACLSSCHLWPGSCV